MQEHAKATALLMASEPNLDDAKLVARLTKSGIVSW